MNLLAKLTTWQGILKPEQIEGPMPTNKELYQKTFDMAWPSAVENVFIALISAVDMIMVGSLGSSAISAVGICTQPKFICLAPIFALNTATIVYVARRKGEGKQTEAVDYTKIALMASITISLLFCLTCFYYSREILTFAGANSDYIEEANTYIRILLLSLIPYSIGLTLTSAQRGAGYTKISLITNLTANLVNIVFNYLLIGGHFGFPMLGVKGAAIATAIGNVVSFTIAFATIVRPKSYIHLNLKPIHNFGIKVKEMFHIFNNAFIEQIFLRFGFFMYSKVVANLGTQEFAAHQVCINIMTITFGLGDGLQVANTSLVGQDLGAKRSDLAIVQTRITHLIGIISAILVSIGLAIYSRELVGVFADEIEVIELAHIPMLMLAFTIMFQIPQVIIVGTLRGAGDVKFVAWMMLICVGIVRPVAAYLFAYTLGFGLIGAWIGLFLDQLLRFTISLYRFKKGIWLTISL